jgi:hypothetical protein
VGRGDFERMGSLPRCVGCVRVDFDCALSGSSAHGPGQEGMGEPELMSVGATGRHGDFDPPHADGDERADLEEFQADRAAGGLRERGVAQPDPAERRDQDIGHGGEPEPERVGAQGVARCPVGEDSDQVVLVKQLSQILRPNAPT